MPPKPQKTRLPIGNPVHTEEEKIFGITKKNLEIIFLVILSLASVLVICWLKPSASGLYF